MARVELDRDPLSALIGTNMGRLEQKAGPEMDKLIAVIPAGWMGELCEIAPAVSFLASPAASQISVSDILIDGVDTTDWPLKR